MTAAIFSSRRRPAPRAQLTLDWALARNTDPITSKAAADAVSHRLAALERVVLDALRAAPAGLTTHEIAERTDVALVSISPRMVILEAKKQVVRTAERRKKRTVWRAA